MSCKKKTCKYFKKCLFKRENDGTGCSDYERGEVKTTKLKKKEKYTEDDLHKAMNFARIYLTYNEMIWANVYIYTVPNKEIVEHLEELLNNKGVSLFA